MRTRAFNSPQIGGAILKTDIANLEIRRFNHLILMQTYFTPKAYAIIRGQK